MTKYLLSIDPGSDDPHIISHTGIALGTFSDTEPYTRIECWSVPNGVRGFIGWLDFFTYDQPYRIVVERFVPWNKMADHTPMRVEGAIQATWPCDEIVWQSSSGKNTLVPDRILKDAGWYDDDSHHHDVREATRHALVYLGRVKHRPTLERYFK